MIWKCLLVDDEPPALKILEQYISMVDQFEIVGACNNAFQGTGLDSQLRQRAVTHLCVMGLATQFSVEHSVRHAADLGYFVTVARDCCASADVEAQQASFRTMAMLADVCGSDEIDF